LLIFSNQENQKILQVLAEISGTIEFGKDIKSKRRIIINPEEGEPIEYLIPKELIFTLMKEIRSTRVT
jgi:hypothetical protein